MQKDLCAQNNEAPCTHRATYPRRTNSVQLSHDQLLKYRKKIHIYNVLQPTDNGNHGAKRVSN